MSKNVATQSDDVFELDFEDDGLETGYTVIQNTFILNYMPKANGNYVKVYLSGLARCFGSKTEQWASARTIAEEQQLSVDTVRRAWRYWEDVGLIRRIPRYVKDKSNFTDFRTEPDAEYCHQISSIIRFRRDLRNTERTSAPMQRCTPPLCTPAHPPYAAVHTIEERHIEERQHDKTESGLVNEIDVNTDTDDHDEAVPDEKYLQRLESLFGLIIDRTPTPSELAYLKRLVATHGIDDVADSLNELMIQLDARTIKSPTRYLKGVLNKWRVEGKRTTNVLEHLRKTSGYVG